MIKVESFTFNPFSENTFVLYDEESLQAAIIDPGCYEPEEQEQLQAFIEKKGLEPALLLNTHCHIDHVLGNWFVKTTWNLPLQIHQIEDQVLRAVPTYAPMYGFSRYQPTEPDAWLEEGQTLMLGKHKLKTLFVPGHAPGHVAFWQPEQKFCINGDCLFAGSIGRTDLPGGDHETLMRSIREKLFTLPDDTKIYCGHGPATTIKQEKLFNPFFSNLIA
ncbi:Zn-dependent hydrolase [Flammeovirgaceae bacterium 311]|nr:Zn-dependent hydrolase [Flammeovirgaceae bacterium 311]